MAALLQFPDHLAKGRKRQRNSLQSMGDHALTKLDGPAPANVVRLALVKAEEHDSGTLAMMLTSAILMALTEERRGYIINQLRFIEAYHHDSRATALLRRFDKTEA